MQITCIYISICRLMCKSRKLLKSHSKLGSHLKFKVVLYSGKYSICWSVYNNFYLIQNKDQLMNSEILHNDTLIKKFILESPEGITAIPERGNSNREIIDNEGRLPLKHIL